MNKKIMFLTATRADFGKLKPLMRAVEDSPSFECSIFITGMHTMARYGYTIKEVLDVGFSNTHVFMNQIHGEPMDLVLSNTISGLSRYVHEYKPDMMIIHGDRIEALAGAIVGTLNNILVAHIEGGEVSGTVDGLIRHSISKLAHLHFVANEEAANRLEQMGENPDAIFVIGSPDIDAMLSEGLPSLEEVKKRYVINYNDYGIVLFHPVTTEREHMVNQANNLVSAVLESNYNYVVIYPNNDDGSECIFLEYERLKNNPRFRIFPSLRFEHFLTLLKNAKFILGNSSAGVREAPIFTVPCINVGTRQQDRFIHECIQNVDSNKEDILMAINRVNSLLKLKVNFHFGQGNSKVRFFSILQEDDLWNTPKQKRFRDVIMNQKS